MPSSPSRKSSSSFPSSPSKKSSSSSPSPALELRSISKSFGATRALSEANLVILPGEIHALLGENGAGKSTLVAIAAGRLAADAGAILREGVEVSFRRARDARDAGIALVPQHDLLIAAASVADNLAFLDPRAPFFETAAARRARVERLSGAFGFDLGAPEARAETLPVGIRQRIEIAGALSGDPDVLILDEPTAVLSPDETAALFAALRKRADGGHAIVLITHRLAEVFAGADRLTLLARGKTVRTCRVSDTSPEEIASLLITGAETGALEEERGRKDTEEKIFLEGEEGGSARRGGAAAALYSPGASAGSGDSQPSKHPARSAGLFPSDIHPSRHAARSDANGIASNLVLTNFAPLGSRAKQISLSLSPGELLVLLAIDGNGADTIARAIAGLEPFEGSVTLGGVTLPRRGDPLTFRARGGAFVPADRREEGLVAALSLSENLALPDPPGRFLLDRRAIRSRADERLEAFGVRASSSSALAGSLSGGNQQKVVLARELAGAPHALIAVHPTRGLDLASAAAVRGRIVQACRAGAAALVVTADPDEARLFEAPLRVVYRGTLSSALSPATPVDTLSRLMAGLAA